MNAETNRLAFFRWLAKTHPGIYAPAAPMLAKGPGLSGLGGWADTIVNALATVGSAVLAKKVADKQVSAQTKADSAARADALAAQLLQINFQRAQAGLPPVDANGNVIPGSSLPPLPSVSQAVARVPAGYPYAAPSIFDSIPLWGWLAAGGVVVLLTLRK